MLVLSRKESEEIVIEVGGERIVLIVVKIRGDKVRLVTDTARGATYFADLSEGERWKFAIDLAADRVGEGGLIVIPQVAFESLDPTNREAIAEHARRRRVNILTAEAADGELRAEAYEAEHAGEAVGV